MDNQKIKGGIQLLKLDKDTGEKLKGAEFTVYDSAGNTIETKTTDENGLVVFSDLPYGDYSYQEKKAPQGYLTDGQKIPFTINQDGKVIEFTADNTLIRGNVLIIKKDKENATLLQGAEFTVFDKDGNAVDTKTTDKNGLVQFDNLPYGDYAYQETKAPQGYVLDSNKYPFKVKNDGETLEFEMENTKIYGGIAIIKKDTGNSKLLSGAEFTLYDSDKNEIAAGKTDKNGACKFEGLPYGQYYYQETKAPKGYYIDEEMYSFDITEDGVVLTVEMFNTRIPTEDTPQTSDPNNLLGWLGGLGASGTAGFVVYKKRKRTI